MIIEIAIEIAIEIEIVQECSIPIAISIPNKPVTDQVMALGCAKEAT
jgi:hypothetical protein